MGCVTYQVCFRVHVSVLEHVDSYDRMKCQNIKAGMFLKNLMLCSCEKCIPFAGLISCTSKTCMRSLGCMILSTSFVNSLHLHMLKNKWF